MKRMFNAACVDLGLINEALGLDPDDGGAEPILDAIAALKELAAVSPQGGEAIQQWRKKNHKSWFDMADEPCIYGHKPEFYDYRTVVAAPASLGEAKAVAPEYLKLQFFRDLNDAQRMAVFEVFGLLPADFDEVTTHGIQCRLFAKLIAATIAQAPPKEPDGMVLVMQEDGNNYCRILTLLDMEEEGDPVVEIERLLALLQKGK